MRIHRYLAPIAVAGLLAGCAASSGKGTGTAEDPPKLAIGTAAAMADMAELTADGPPGYRLTATLPDGPTEAQVRRLVGEVDAAAVTRLARALGLTGTPERRADGWQVGRPGGATLVVRSDSSGYWSYVSPYVLACDDVASAPTDGVGGGSGEPDAPTCAVSSNRPPTRAPGTSVARTVAAPVLAAVGLESSDATASDWGEVTEVRADPTVAGLVAFGLGTSVQAAVVSGTPLVLSASGYLTTVTEPGDTYPLISARAAWRQATQQETPAIALVCPHNDPDGPDRWVTDDQPAPGVGNGTEPGADTPAPPPDVSKNLPQPRCAQDPVEMSSVTLGLTMRITGDQWLLIPAWLFTADSGETLEVVAVDPAYLTDPVDPGTGGGSGASGSTGGTGGAVAPGSAGEEPAKPAEPAEPATVEPAPAES